MGERGDEAPPAGDRASRAGAGAPPYDLHPSPRTSVMISSEQTSYGHRVDARGALRADEADAWLAELRRRADDDSATPIALLVDVRGLTWDPASASAALVPAFRRLGEAGVRRTAVVTDGAASLLELRRMAWESDAYPTIRFFAAEQSPAWERAATRWAADGEEEPQPRQSERRAELAHFVDALGEALALCDLHGRVLFTNAAFARLTDDADDRARLAAELETTARAGAGRVGTTATRELRTARGAYRFRRHAAAEGLCGAAGVQVIAVERVGARAASDVELRSQFGLTTRELVVARLLAVGRTNAEIGAELGISPFTARNHAERVMGKLGVSNRAKVASVLIAA